MTKDELTQRMREIWLATLEQQDDRIATPAQTAIAAMLEARNEALEEATSCAYGSAYSTNEDYDRGWNAAIDYVREGIRDLKVKP